MVSDKRKNLLKQLTCGMEWLDFYNFQRVGPRCGPRLYQWELVHRHWALTHTFISTYSRTRSLRHRGTGRTTVALNGICGDDCKVDAHELAPNYS